MKIATLLFVGFFFAASIGTMGQSPSAPYINPVADEAVLNELQKISRSVLAFSEALKVFVEKSDNEKGKASERQHRLMLGMDMLVKTEERIANFQKLQIDLVEKINENRGKLAQVEIDLRPRNIDRSLAFEGTTETPELRENRRSRLTAERTSLSTLITQIQNTLNETLDSLSEAQAQAYRLRRTILPQLEREFTDP